MGVGAPQGADPAVQIVAKRQLFTGGLRMEIHQGKIRSALLQQPVRQSKGIFGVPLECAAADEVHHAEPQAIEIENLAAVARHSAGQVGGAQEPRGLIQHTANLHFAEGVVAKGHGVGSGVIDPPRLLAGQTHAGDVFPVDHGERNVFQLLQGPQMAFQMGETCLAYHIAHSQNGIEHGVPPNI